jgi:hypothetical protein
MKTVVIRNNTGSEQIWLRTFLANEQYTIPTDNGLVFKYANLEVFLQAVAAGNASIGNGDIFFSSLNDQFNYIKGIDTEPKDTDGAKILRPKAAQAGWTYHLTAPEFTTSTLGSIFHEDVAGNVLSETSIKFYNSGNTELTTQGSCDTDCVKTVFSFEPTWNYEIIGGTLKTINDISSNMRVWVVAVPDIPAASGGSKVMVQGVNLKFIDPNNGIEADGKVSKFMTYSATYHTNKIQVTIKHPAGHKEEIMMAFELFRA